MKKLSNEKMENVMGGVMVDHATVCGLLFQIVGYAHWIGDKALASAAWSGWVSGGCYIM